MIPKIIHYCWLSNDPFPNDIKRYMDSWQKHLSEYEFIHWDKEKLYSIENKYAIEAFENKKYAFAADFIRCYAVYNFGGIYLDTDVEVLKSFDSVLDNKSFIGLDSRGDLEAAIFGAQKKQTWLKEALNFYENKSFINEDGSENFITMPNIFKIVLKDLLPKDLKTINNVLDLQEIELYPFDYFSPKDYTNGILRKSKNTIAIHHFTASWISHKSWYWRRHQIKILLSKLLRFN